MKLPLSWIKEYANIEVSSKEFEEKMTMSGTKVCGVQNLGENIEKVVTGRILSVEKHPNADKLVVCQVDVSGEVLQIVTGATNVFEGAIVPVATDGAILPSGVKIKKCKMRDVDSFGMLCSTDEVFPGPEPARGIMILADDTPLGVDIRDVLGLNDTIFEFELTANRPDCQSLLGIAREAAVTFGAQYREQQAEDTGRGTEDISRYASVEVMDKELCPRYTARVVKNIKIEPSPEWMQKRLIMCGVRPINNIVDITNYVMLEYGQPMHAFDLNELSGRKIVVRRANEGENITTLDDKPRVLGSDMLVIADDARAIAVAGVMGGQNSEIKENTKEILFESANFLNSSVRQTAKKLGLRTDASARYEKGISPMITFDAVNRACELVNRLGAGEVVDGVIDIQGNISKPKRVKFDVDGINRLLGTNISREFMIEKLESLGFVLEGDEFCPPLVRADIEGTADLAEEVARFYGYNNIPSTLLRGETTPGGRNSRQKFEVIVRDRLIAQGLNEILTYSFVSPNEHELLGIDKTETVTIRNPLGAEHSVMRTNTIGSMLEVLSGNYNYRNEKAWLFEIGTVYIPTQDELPDEKKIITIGMYGECDFYDIKGMVEGLIEAVGISSYGVVSKEDAPLFHPGQTAGIIMRQKEVAVIGCIHPNLTGKYDIGTPAYVATIDFDALFECRKLDKKYRPLPKYPAVVRDIAVIVGEQAPVGKIEEIIRRSNSKLIEKIKLFDVYKGEQVEKGQKSVAYSITFRASDRTLTDEEVGEVMNEITEKLHKELGARLR